MKTKAPKRDHDLKNGILESFESDGEGLATGERVTVKSIQRQDYYPAKVIYGNVSPTIEEARRVYSYTLCRIKPS